MDNVWLRILAIIEERGWCKGQFIDKDGRMCITGAYYFTHGAALEHLAAPANAPSDAFEYCVDSAEYERLANAVVAHQQVRRGLVTMWNDHPMTTVDDVRAVLTALAAEDGATP